MVAVRAPPPRVRRLLFAPWFEQRVSGPIAPSCCLLLGLLLPLIQNTGCLRAAHRVAPVAAATARAHTAHAHPAPHAHTTHRRCAHRARPRASPAVAVTPPPDAAACCFLQSRVEPPFRLAGCGRQREGGYHGIPLLPGAAVARRRHTALMPPLRHAVRVCVRGSGARAVVRRARSFWIPIRTAADMRRPPCLSGCQNAVVQCCFCVGV